MNAAELIVYGDPYSGNCYKLKLLMSWLDIGHRWVDVDILKGETHTAEFLAKNPNARIPLLDLGEGRYLAESNAILNYLADGSQYVPTARYERASMLQWQFFEQYSHEPYIATSRFIVRYLGSPPERQKDLEARREGGYSALRVMEGHLAQHDFFVVGGHSIADISLYAYTHVADEGGFALDDYPAIRAWLRRVESHPKHVSMG